VGIINHTRALRTGQKVMDTILEWAYKQAKEKERSTKTRSQKQLRKRKPATLSK